METDARNLDYVLGSEHREELRRRAVRVAQMCGAIVTAIGVVVTAGWLLGIPVLQSVLPGSVSMTFNAAIAFIGAGSALVIVSSRVSPAMRAAGAAAAVLASLIGAATLIEYLTGRSLGIDELLVRDPLAAVAPRVPGRMALHSALAFVFAGVGLLLLGRTNRRQIWLAQALSGAVAGLAIFTLGGHLYHGRGAYTDGVFAGMAIHTALAFLVQSYGMLAARPRVGVGDLLFSPTVTALIARRWLVGALVVPMSLGFIAVRLEATGTLDSASASALLVGLLTVIMCAAVVLESAVASRIERERLDLERERQRLIGELGMALAEVRNLSGLLPICSHCKRIRDDGGDWEKLEQYIQDRSEAQFSHGMCPDCMQRHYGEVIG